MKVKLDLTKEYGIVLEGGGAKGAYQIGAWKALREAGVRIRGVAGTSVGALNGAMICMGDLPRAERIWETISYSKVMDVEEEFMESVIKGDLKSANLSAFIRDAVRVINGGGLDVTPLRKLIAECCDEETIRNSPIDLYVVTISLTDRELLNVNVKETEPGMIADMLLASAYFPTFKQEKLHGKTYIDGGGLDSVPVDALLDNGYKDIIVIRVYGIGHEKEIEIPEDVTVYTVAPRQDLGKVLEFDKKKSRRNMRLGYYDTMRLIYGLEGRHYYIDAEEKRPEEYFLQMMQDAEPMAEILKSAYLSENQRTMEWCRAMPEVIFPAVAKELGLTGAWTYRELYFRIMEQAARVLRISRFAIYTEEELREKIRKKRTEDETLEEIDKRLPPYLTALIQYSNL
jgi:NTE family protein